MANLIYNRGLDELSVWTTGTFKFLLLKGTGYTANRDNDYVSDLTPASNEVSSAGYSRQTAGTPTRTIDDTLDRITYDCTDPSFGTVTTGQTVTGMVLYRFVTVDADSPLVAYFDLSPGYDTAAFSPFVVAIAGTGVAYVDQAA